ncbi:MAG: MATE family efflux transporter [Planctomycetes bacterium]|nr:MATE family efflux transporter [Planctomycetota bacterium]
MSAPPETGVQPSLTREIFDAIRGRPRDYTVGPLRRATFILAIPMVLEMSMQSVFSVVDMYFVSQLGDEAAVGGVINAEGLLSIVFAVGLGLSMGAAATVARRIGEGDEKGARSATVQAIGLGLIIAAPIGIVGAFFIDTFFGWMGVSDTIAAAGRGYGTHLIAGCPTIFLLFLINGAFRGAGDAISAMKALWVANIINMALDPVLIFGWGPIPAMGVTGAAVATNIGRGIGVLYQLRLLAKGRIGVRWADVRIVPATMSRLFKVSRIGIFQFFVGTTSYTGLIMIINHVGQDPDLAPGIGDGMVAGFGVAVRIIMFVFFPAWGIGNAAATLVGQSLGAGNPQRAEAAAWVACRANVVFLGTVGALSIAFPETIVGWLNDQPETLKWGAQCLRFTAFAYLMMAFSMVLMMAFNGAGDTWTPTRVSLIAHWALKLPAAWLLSVTFGLGVTGVFIALPLAEVLAATLFIILFRRGRWKETVV